MKIRQGKDILIRWKVLTNGQDITLEGRNIALVMTTPLGREKVVEHDVEGSVVVARLRGTALIHLGDYTLSLWENRGEEGQTAVDAVDAFTLVQYSTQEDNGSPCGNLEYEVAELATASMDVLTGGGGGSIAVEVVDNLDSDATDKALSARQGKELKGMIPTKVSELDNDEGYITEIPDGYATKDDVNEAIAEIDMVTPIVNQTQLAVEIQPNVLNVWGEVRYLELTFADAEEGKANEYMAQFTSGETATTLVLPSTIVWLSEPNIQANKIYQLSVINNLGVIGEFSNE